MTDTIGTASVTLIRENEDGSADYQCNFSPEELDGQEEKKNILELVSLCTP